MGKKITLDTKNGHRKMNGYAHYIVMMVIINGAKLDTKDGHRKMNGYPHSQCDGGNHFLEIVTPITL